MTLSPALLIVDDDKELLQSLSRMLSMRLGITRRVLCASSHSEAIRIAAEERPHVVLLDLCLNSSGSTEDGFSLLTSLVSYCRGARFLVMTGSGGVDEGIKALSLGAASFLSKPAKSDHLVALIEDGIIQANLQRTHIEKLNKAHDDLSDVLVGLTPVMQKLREEVIFLASTNQSVLLCGETGVGKGVAARALHSCSSRSRAPFIRYQPSGQSGDLTVSDLFGHMKGAFTGAHNERRGLIEEAEEGTLFLDEVDQFSHEVQVLLLGVLQERKFRRIGENRERDTKVRIVAATNAVLDDPASHHALRRDLLHRLSHATLTIPPLRERIDDIPHLLDALRRKWGVEEGASAPEFTNDALIYLREYHWPGNVREFENVVIRALYKARHVKSLSVTKKDLLIENYQGSKRKVEKEFDRVSEMPSQINSFDTQVRDFKRSLAEKVVRKHSGNATKAAAELGIDRATLRKILVD
jgi:two-component system, NtrC family, response regulator AtoC